MLTLVFLFTQATVWARSQKWIDSRRDWFSNQTIKIRVIDPKCFFFFFSCSYTEWETERKTYREFNRTIADLLYYITIVLYCIFFHMNLKSLIMNVVEIFQLPQRQESESPFKTELLFSDFLICMPVCIWERPGVQVHNPSVRSNRPVVPCKVKPS